MAAKTSKSKKTGNAYVRDDNPALQKVVRGLRSLVKAAVPGTKITLNSWGIPTFETKDPFCFYMAGKNHITFGFHYGTSLNDPEGLLEGTGKNIRHVKLRAVQDLEQKGLKNLVLAAARLEGKPPMKGMSGKRK
ncbi:MAG TPA: DUF1801 domain-containing protein [Candidatus Acidoferrum sp.]|nr:DUF1801 domain-containing protein [Candidatus Acidoferrum sp.]